MRGKNAKAWRKRERINRRRIRESEWVTDEAIHIETNRWEDK